MAPIYTGLDPAVQDSGFVSWGRIGAQYGADAGGPDRFDFTILRVKHVEEILAIKLPNFNAEGLGEEMLGGG